MKTPPPPTKLTITGVGSFVTRVLVVDLAHDLVVDQRELLPRGKLPAARVTGKARQVEHQIARLPNPVRGGDRAAALGALGAEGSVQGERRRI